MQINKDQPLVQPRNLISYPFVSVFLRRLRLSSNITPFSHSLSLSRSGFRNPPFFPPSYVYHTKLLKRLLNGEKGDTGEEENKGKKKELYTGGERGKKGHVMYAGKEVGWNVHRVWMGGLCFISSHRCSLLGLEAVRCVWRVVCWCGGKVRHGRGERADRADGALDTRVWVCVVLVTRLGALLCRAEWRVRLSLLLEPVAGSLLV